MKSKFKELSEFFIKPTLQKKITVALVVANILVLSLYASGWSFGRPQVSAAQDNKRVVIKEDILKNEPVEVEDVKVKGSAVKLGEAFEGEPEWLKTLNFRVRNRSSEAITFVVLDLDFPETKDTGAILTHTLIFGQRPDSESTHNNPPLYLKPNESIAISLEPDYDVIKKSIERLKPSVGYIHKIKVRLDQVIFEDGTMYSGGAIFKRNPDPNSPRKWVPASGS